MSPRTPILSVLLVAACSSNSTVTAGERSEPDAGETKPTADARYLVSMGIVTPNGANGLVFPLNALSANVKPDQGAALEIPGAGFLASIPGRRDFLVASGEEPAITRYSYGPDGFERGATFSLVGFGVTDPIRVLRVFDEERGYIATGGGHIFQFEPRAMGVTRGTELEGFERVGYYPAASSTYGRSFVRGDSVFFVYSWWNDPDGTTPLGETALVHLDRTTGDLSASFYQGCGDLDSGAVDTEGTLWLASAGYGAAARAAGMKGAPATCLLRLPADKIDINDADVTSPWEFEGAEVGDLLYLGENQALVRYFDATARVETEPPDTDAIAGAAAWKWGRLNLATLAITDEPDLAMGTVPSTSFSIGDAQYVGTTSADYSETVFSRVDSAEVGTGVTLPGFPISLVELD